MDFSERLNLYKDGGMINDEDIKDVLNVIDMFKKEYNVVLEEENADTFIAHLCSAYSRNKTGEEIEELSDNVRKELENLDTYKESQQILSRLIEVTNNPLSQVEKDYALLHINNLIAKFKEQNNWNH